MGIVLNSFNWLGDQVKARIYGDIDTRMRMAGQSIVTRAQALAHVDTGEMRAGIGFIYNQSTHTLQIYADAPHSIFEEFGTRYHIPHPYIRPALIEAGRLMGINLEIGFANIPHINAPMYAHQAGFAYPPRLTARQRQHVATHLGPTSRRLYRGNVRRAKIRVRRSP